MLEEYGQTIIVECGQGSSQIVLVLNLHCYGQARRCCQALGTINIIKDGKVNVSLT